MHAGVKGVHSIQEPSARPGVEVSGHQYHIKPLNTFDQFDIARRLAPICSMLALQPDKSKLQDNFPRAFCALTSQLSKDDMSEVNRLAFSQVFRRQGDNWSPVYIGGQFAFSDIGLPEMLQLMWAVLEAHRLIDFFAGGLSDLTPSPT